MSKRPSLNNKPFRRLRGGGGDEEITGVTPAGGDSGTESDEFCIALAGKKPPGLLCAAAGGVANGGTIEDIDEGSCRESITGKEREDDIIFGGIGERYVGPLI